MRRRYESSGYSLIELLTTVSVLGILVGIAAPTLRSATHRADAARVLADMSVARSALFEFREVTGRLPDTGSWGVVPADLAPHLNNLPFVHGDLAYRLVTSAARDRVDFLARYPRSSHVGAALRRFRRPGSDSGSMIWSTTQSRWRLLENNQ